MQIIPPSFYQTQPWSNLKLLPQNGDQIILSAIFFQAVFLIGGAFSNYSSHYRNLKSSKQASWAIHIVSMVFSLIIVTLAYPLFSDEALMNDKLFGYSDYSRSVYAITCGYFLWDTLISIYYIGETGIPFVFHGSACFCVFFLSYLPYVQHYGAAFLMFELRYDPTNFSTVFLNVHWFCDKTGLTGSKLQWINGMILLLVFFSVRCCFGTYKMLDFVFTAFPHRDKVPFGIFYIYAIAATGLGSLNFYWFATMIRSVMSRFKETKKKTE